MAYVIAEPCLGTKDRSCEAACPVNCIVEGAGHLAIDPDRCVNCGACVAACPVSAIFHESRLPSEWADWRERNRAVAAAAGSTSTAANALSIRGLRARPA